MLRQLGLVGQGSRSRESHREGAREIHLLVLLSSSKYNSYTQRSSVRPAENSYGGSVSSRAVLDFPQSTTIPSEETWLNTAGSPPGSQWDQALH